MHRSLIGCILVPGVLAAARPAEAQWAGAGGVLRARAAAATTPMDLRIGQPGAEPRAWPYVVGGALLGGLVMAGAIALAVDGSESLTPPIAYAPAVAGAALAGAGTGFLVYRTGF